MNNRGQFFSPDLIIAVLVFMIALGLFFVSSDAVFNIVFTSDAKNIANEKIHSSVNSLLYSSGEPVDWHVKNIGDINFFGLALEKNVLSEEKIIALAEFIDTNNIITREKLGLGQYYIKIKLIDSSGVIIVESNNSFVDTLFELNYDRIVLVNDELMLLRSVIALEK
jgi:hypothetical protein